MLRLAVVRCLVFLFSTLVVLLEAGIDEASHGSQFHKHRLRRITQTRGNGLTDKNEALAEGLHKGDETLPSMYHRSASVRRLISELAAPGPRHCRGLHLSRAVFTEGSRRTIQSLPLRELEGEDAWSYELGSNESALDVVRISREDLGEHREKPVRYALFFGEHGRELISTEVGIHLVKAFCGHEDIDDTLRRRALQILSFADILLLPNIDESGRRVVEDGEYCQRQNLEHVDLNRNWDYKWGETKFRDQGQYPFSEPETRIAKKHLEAFRPNVFLSVHSGDNALWMPGAYGFDDGEVRRQKRNVWDSLVKIASNVKDYTHCNCKIGAPGKIAHKHMTGTSIDYAGLKMNVPYAMAWEIWLGKTHSCLGHYNPLTRKEYDSVLDHWSTSMVYFAEMVDMGLRAPEYTLAVEDYSLGDSVLKKEQVETHLAAAEQVQPEANRENLQKEDRSMHRRPARQRSLEVHEAGNSSTIANGSSDKDMQIVANAAGKLQRFSSHGARPNLANVDSGFKTIDEAKSANAMVEPFQKRNFTVIYVVALCVFCIILFIGALRILDCATERLLARKSGRLPLRCSAT